MLIIQVLDDRSGAAQQADTARLAIQWRGPQGTPGRSPSAASAGAQERPPTSGCLDVRLDANPELEASMLDVIGQAYIEYGSPVQAIDVLNEALKLRKKVFGESHPSVAESQRLLASACRHAAQFAAAEGAIDAAIGTLARTHGTTSVEYADAQLERSAIKLAANKLDAARKDAADSFETFDKKADVRRVHSLDISARVIDVCAAGDKQQLGDAKKLYERIQSDALLGIDNPWRTHFTHNEATILHGLGEFAAARDKFDAVIAAWRKESGENRPGLVDALINRGRTLRALGRLADAKADVEAALNLDRQIRGQRHPYVAYDLVCLARLLMEEDSVGNKAEAQRALDDAIKIYRENDFHDHAYLEVALRRRYALTQDSKDQDEADRIKSRIAAECGAKSAC